jgi:hypothetical protein
MTNLHAQHKPRFTVQQRRAMLFGACWWTVGALCGALVVCWVR